MAEAYRYVGFYGRRTTPAITPAGKLFFGQVIEVHDLELMKQLDASDSFEKVTNTCHWIGVDGKRCPHIKDESEVYCPMCLLKLRMDAVTESPFSPDKPAVQETDRPAAKPSFDRIVSGEDSGDDGLKKTRPSGRKKKWSAD